MIILNKVDLVGKAERKTDEKVVIILIGAVSAAALTGKIHRFRQIVNANLLVNIIYYSVRIQELVAAPFTVLALEVEH